MILLGVITSLSLLTGMIDTQIVTSKGQATLVNKYGDTMQISTVKNAGRLCQSQLELNYGASLSESVVNSDSTSFDESRELFLVSMDVKVGDQDLAVSCHIKSNDIMVSFLDIQ